MRVSVPRCALGGRLVSLAPSGELSDLLLVAQCEVITVDEIQLDSAAADSATFTVKDGDGEFVVVE